MGEKLNPKNSNPEVRAESETNVWRKLGSSAADEYANTPEPVEYDVRPFNEARIEEIENSVRDDSTQGEPR